jgi:hypothetical protein
MHRAGPGEAVHVTPPRFNSRRYIKILEEVLLVASVCKNNLSGVRNKADCSGARQLLHTYSTNSSGWIENCGKVA